MIMNLDKQNPKDFQAYQSMTDKAKKQYELLLDLLDLCEIYYKR